MVSKLKVTEFHVPLVVSHLMVEGQWGSLPIPAEDQSAGGVEIQISLIIK